MTKTTHKLIQGTLATYDPYRLDAAIKSNPDQLSGGVLNVCANIRFPSIGLASPAHPMVSNALSDVSKTRSQNIFQPPAPAGSKSAFQNVVGSSKFGASDTMTAITLWQGPGCMAVHGVEHKSDVTLFTGDFYRYSASVGSAIALATMPEIWRSVATCVESDYLHAPLASSTKSGDIVRRFPLAVSGMVSTGDPIALNRISSIDISGGNMDRRLRANLAGHLELRGNMSTDEAQSAASAVIDDHYAILSDEHHFIATRAHHLNRLVLGMYDFYGLEHGPDRGYLVEPSVAAAMDFRPAATRASFPNPMHVQPTCTLDGQSSPLFTKATPYASSPTVTPTYLHPNYSPDYGRDNHTGDAAYRATQRDQYKDSWFMTVPAQEQGIGDVDWANDHEAHLYHVAWGATDLINQVREQGRDVTPARASMLVQGLLPADQLLACCTLATHNADLGALEAMRHMNPLAWEAAAQMAGVPSAVSDRFKTMSLAMSGADVDLKGLTAAEQLLFASLGDPQDPEVMDRLQEYGVRTSTDAYQACVSAHVAATQDLLLAITKYHARNVLDRHPVLMHPSVVMPQVRTQHTLSSSKVPGTAHIAMEINREMTTVVMNLALGNLEFPVHERFANHPMVRMALGDRDGGSIVFDDGPLVVDGRAYSRPGNRSLPIVQTYMCGLPMFIKEGAFWGPQVAEWSFYRNQVSTIAASHLMSGYTPTSFYASVLELSTHSDEFISYRDQLTEHLADFNPQTGESSYPAPSADPFRILGRSLVEYPTPAINGDDPSPQIIADNLSKGSTPVLNGSNAPLAALVTRCLREMRTEELRVALHVDAYNISKSPLIKTAPLDCVRLQANTENLITWVSEALKAAPANMTGALKDGSLKVLEQERAQQRRLQASASTLRLLQGVRAHIQAGAVTNQLTSGIPRTLDEDAREESALTTFVSAVHYCGLTKTKTGAARLMGAEMLMGTFPYVHEIDGIALQASAPHMANAINQCYESGLQLANQHAPLHRGGVAIPTESLLKEALPHYTDHPQLSVNLKTMGAFTEHAKRHAPGKPNALILPGISAADSLIKGPNGPNPISQMDQAGPGYNDIRSLSSTSLSSLCGNAATNNLVMRGVGKLFFGPSRNFGDKAELSATIRFFRDDLPSDGGVKVGFRAINVEDGVIQGEGSLDGEVKAGVEALDRILAANAHETQGTALAAHSKSNSPFLSMCDERVINTRPVVDDLASVSDNLRYFGAGETATTPPLNIVRIGSFLDHNAGIFPVELHSLKSNFTLKEGLNSPEVAASPRERTRSRRV